MPLLRLFAGDLVHALRKGHLVPGRGPRRFLPLTEGERHGVFARARLRGEGQRVLAALRGRHVRFQLGLRDLHAVAGQQRHAPVGGGGGEHAAVGDHRAVRLHLGHDVLVVVAHLLHLRAFGPVPVDDAVAAEVVVRRPVAEVAAIGVVRAAVAVPGADALVDEVPDEPALIERLLIGVFGVLVHRAARVAHGVHVLAQDEGPAAVLGQELAHLRRRRVHLAFDVRGIVAPAVAGHALVVHQPRVVQAAEQGAHLVDDLAAEGFVAAAPDEHAGVVLVALVGGCHAVQQHGQPFHAVCRAARTRWACARARLGPRCRAFPCCSRRSRTGPARHTGRRARCGWGNGWCARR